MKQKLKQEIIKIVSIPPKREGDTGYTKLTDEEIEKIVELFKKTIERFMEETIRENDFLPYCYSQYERIKQKQQQWLKENL